MNKITMVSAAFGLWLTASACQSEPATATGAGTTSAAGDVSGTDAGSATDGAGSASTGPTWHKDVARLVTDHCTQCHGSGGIAPFSLDNYASAKATMAAGLASIDANRMPPWSARESATCKPRFGWRHDLRLTAAERKTLGDWLANGAPEGNPADAPKAVPVQSSKLEAVDVVAAPKAPFVAAGHKDQLRCFVLDATYEETKYLNGIQVLPGNPLVVHHVLLFVDPNNSSAKHADKDGQYDCFGSAQLDQGGNLIGAWAPGSVPLEFPVGMGATLPKGSKIVMQVHYHPLGEPAAPDLTKVQLRYVKGAPTMLGDTVLIGNAPGGKNGEGLLPGPNDPASGPKFLIPAGAKDHTEEMVFTIPASMNGKPMPQFKVYAVGTHMHYVGTNMQIRLERPPPKAACTQAMVDPLVACLAKACPGKQAAELAVCAQENCKAALAGLDTGCGQCLQAEALKGSSQQATLQACTTAPAATATGPADECLIETPNWDFNWQRIYVYDTALDQLPTLTSGDRLRMKCTYDNTMGNKFVAAALKAQGKSAPVPVSLGEETLDEMCLAVVQVLYAPPK